MELSIILIGWNDSGHLQQCIPSIREAARNIEHEIIYVDNGSSDGTLSFINRYFPEINILRNNKNLGVSKARNQGIRKASGDFIWILDSDTEVNRAALEDMLKYEKDHTDTGICACKLKDKDGNIQNSCRKFPTAKYKLKSAAHSILLKTGFISPSEKTLNYDYDISGSKALEVQYVIGACQLIKKEVIEQIGMLDEKIFYGPEDADFCLRAQEAGWKVVYLPYTSMIHHYQRVTTHRIFSKLTYIHIQSLIYFFKKHKGHDLLRK